MQQIIYDSRGGNTRKLADAIAEELEAEAVDVSVTATVPGTGVLFLGSGYYGGKPGKNILKFIETHDFRGRRVALFGTSGGGKGLEVEAMAEALKGKGATVIGKYYCSGQFLLFVSQGHPNVTDLDAARKFAREMAGLQKQPPVGA